MRRYIKQKETFPVLLMNSPFCIPRYLHMLTLFQILIKIFFFIFQFESFIPCSERIVRAVTDMVLLFPEESGHSSISASLSSLTAAATHFESECRMLILRSQKETLNQNFVTQQVIQCAFDIAKATKQLVALFQQFYLIVIYCYQSSHVVGVFNC